LCPSGGWFVIHFSSEIWFLLFGKSNWKWNSLMCQVGWHTRLWIIYIQLSFYCYCIKFEHICQGFGFELSLVDTLHMPNCSSEPFGVFFVLRRNIWHWICVTPNK
jgi:hypothetical protein